MDTRYYKICIIGESNVGKSSIADQYVNSTFDPYKIATIGAAYYSKIIEYQNSNIHLQMWDTAGQERYRSITPLYYRNAAGIVLVVDNTNYKSLSISNYWLKSIKQHIPDVPIFMAINKCDLPSKLSDHFIPSILEIFPTIKYKFVSAKTNDGIDELFNELIETIYNDSSLPVTTIDTVKIKPEPKMKYWFNKCSIF